MPRSLAPDVSRVLVVAQGDEPGMAQVIVGGPLEKFELSDEYRLQPLALRHFGFRKALSPPAAPGFR